jgi:transposase
MDAREERGRLLAQTVTIKRLGEKWIVPSSTGAGQYLVDLYAEEGARCDCPDSQLRRRKCKHAHCVEWVLIFEAGADGTQVVTETVKITRKTYKQDWPAYNAAQAEEETRVAALLRSLVDGVQNPPHPGRGPKPVPLSDAVYAMAMKVYTGFSGRRASTRIQERADAGHLLAAPAYNTVFDCFAKPEITPLLAALVADSAAPLASVESKFAVDSTGFGTSVYRRWFDHKYGREMKEAKWIKAHALVGVNTNVVCAIRVTESNANDSPEFAPLVKATNLRFDMREVSADKAYLSHDNLATVESVGAVPYVPFKSNSTGDGSAAWRRMYGMFMLRTDEFLAHYHARSNVESTFSAIKRKFGGAVRSKTLVAQTNEVLCKVLAFNLTVLVHATRELGIEPVFSTAPTVH